MVVCILDFDRYRICSLNKKENKFYQKIFQFLKDNEWYKAVSRANIYKSVAIT